VFGRLGLCRRRVGRGGRRVRARVGRRLAAERLEPAQPFGVRFRGPGAHLGGGRLVFFPVTAAAGPLLLVRLFVATVVGRRRRRLGRAVVLGRQQLVFGLVLPLQLLQLRLDHRQLVEVALDHRQTGRQPIAVRVAAAAGRRQRRFGRRPLGRRLVVDLHVLHPKPALLDRHRGRGGASRGHRCRRGRLLLGRRRVTRLQFALVPGRPLQRVLQLVRRELGPSRGLPDVVPRAHRQLESRFHYGFFTPQPDQRRAVFGGQYTVVGVGGRPSRAAVLVVIVVGVVRGRRRRRGVFFGPVRRLSGRLLIILPLRLLRLRLLLFLFTIVVVTLTGNTRGQLTHRACRCDRAIAHTEYMRYYIFIMARMTTHYYRLIGNKWSYEPPPSPPL